MSSKAKRQCDRSTISNDCRLFIPLAYLGVLLCLLPTCSPVSLSPEVIAGHFASYDKEDILVRCSVTSSSSNFGNPLASMEEDDNEDLPGDDIIVKFNTYRNISDHVAWLYSFTGNGCDDWRNIVRENVAAQKFPTDFIVLRLLTKENVEEEVEEERERHVDSIAGAITSKDEERGQHILAEKLQNSPHIQAIAHQRLIDRSLFAYHGAEGGEEDGDAGAGVLEQRLRRMMGVNEEEEGEVATQGSHHRKIMAKGLISITKYTNADALWRLGHTGRGVRVAVFDTGIPESHPSFRNVRERTDWTDEETLEDHIGHGTFVAGLIASTHPHCAGFAPDAEVYAFRVFNKKQVSYTSWFLDAFNYAMQIGIDVLNLSIGGPDFLDRPFVEKVEEMSANGIIVVSAIGNDGPRYGTLNNPADQLDVIGVGGITYDDRLATFSSRGMTTWELPAGYGRVKPDIVAYGKGIRGPTTSGSGCRSLSGTSVASPVVAGMVTLLAGMTAPALLNPAMMKQILTQAATPVPGHHIFEQGMGKVDLLKAAKLAENYVPRASTIPARLDLTECPYFWPYCSQPAYYSSMPVVANLTVLNPLSVAGTIENVRMELNADGFAGDTALLAAEFSHSELLWPWTGWLSVSFRVTRAGLSMNGVVSGRIVFDVVSDEKGEASTVVVPLRINLAPPPPRSRRLLWDQFHSLRYPSGYFPRDNLAIKSDILDWNGDHVHTNFRDFYTDLRARGYFVEVSGGDWTCVDAANYAALLLVDPEEAYFEEEIQKLADDVYTRGLSLLVVGEWYNSGVMKKLKFLDQNTQSWWLPQTGGANLPELNRVLAPFHMALSDRVLDATVEVKGGGKAFRYESGTSLFQFPKGGRLFSVRAKDTVSGTTRYFPIMGIYSTGTGPGNGRVAVLGDSNCLDGNHRRGMPCYDTVDTLLAFLCHNKTDEKLFPPALILHSAFRSDFGALPQPMPGTHFARYSRVLLADNEEAEGETEGYDKSSGLPTTRRQRRPQCLAEILERRGPLPNISTLAGPAVNESEALAALPKPGGGFYPSTRQGWPYFALGLMIGGCALGIYIRYYSWLASMLQQLLPKGAFPPRRLLDDSREDDELIDNQHINGGVAGGNGGGGHHGSSSVGVASASTSVAASVAATMAAMTATTSGLPAATSKMMMMNLGGGGGGLDSEAALAPSSSTGVSVASTTIGRWGRVSQITKRSNNSKEPLFNKV